MKRLMFFLLLITPLPLLGVTRTEAITTAKSYALYPWHCSQQNLHGSCESYQTSFSVGDFIGVPYHWGGFDTLFEFEQKIQNGKVAGSPVGATNTSCQTGVDCSGFVSQCLKLTTKYSTSMFGDGDDPNFPALSDPDDILPGDMYNSPGNHVVLWYQKLADGTPYFFEAVPPQVIPNFYSSLNYLTGYHALKYKNIQGTSLQETDGTLENPRLIQAFPYTDHGNTSNSPSDVFDNYIGHTDHPEYGPEVIYQFILDKPGRLTMNVTCDQGVDIDLYLLEAQSLNHVLARDDIQVTYDLTMCGVYYIVADSYGSTSPKPGAYTLTASFTPKTAGQCVGNTADIFEIHGHLGETCSNPNNRQLPPCNPTFGATTCIYDSETSWCSKECQTNDDCAEFNGGCCGDLGGNQGSYCFPSAYCEEGGANVGGADIGILDGGTGGFDLDVSGASNADSGFSENDGANSSGNNTDQNVQGNNDSGNPSNPGGEVVNGSSEGDVGSSCSLQFNRTSLPINLLPVLFLFLLIRGGRRKLTDIRQ